MLDPRPATHPPTNSAMSGAINAQIPVNIPDERAPCGFAGSRLESPAASPSAYNRTHNPSAVTAPPKIAPQLRRGRSPLFSTTTSAIAPLLPARPKPSAAPPGTQGDPPANFEPNRPQSPPRVPAPRPYPPAKLLPPAPPLR